MAWRSPVAGRAETYAYPTAVAGLVEEVPAGALVVESWDDPDLCCDAWFRPEDLEPVD